MKKTTEDPEIIDTPAPAVEIASDGTVTQGDEVYESGS